MAISVAGTTTGGGSAGTSITISHTVAAGSDRALVVVVAGRAAGAITAVAYGGVAMSKVAERDGGGIVSIWYLDDPAVGTANVVVTKGSGKEENVAIYSLTGAASTDASGTADSFGNTQSVTVNTNRQKGIVICGVAVNDAGALTYTGGANSILNANQGDQYGGSSWEAYSGGGDVTETWSSTNSRAHSLAGIEIYEAASGLPKILNINQAVNRASTY